MAKITIQVIVTKVMVTKVMVTKATENHHIRKLFIFKYIFHHFIIYLVHTMMIIVIQKNPTIASELIISFLFVN